MATNRKKAPNSIGLQKAVQLNGSSSRSCLVRRKAQVVRAIIAWEMMDAKCSYHLGKAEASPPRDAAEEVLKGAAAAFMPSSKAATARAWDTGAPAAASAPVAPDLSPSPVEVCT